jgi:hypothetical protein
LSVTKRISLCVRCSRANSPVHQFTNVIGRWPSPAPRIWVVKSLRFVTAVSEKYIN